MHDMENEPLDNRVPIIERHKEIDLIQSCINRMAQNSFQVKGWTVALFAVILALLPEKVESTNKFFLGIVMLAISIMFWYLDSFFLAAERNYRKIYGWVLQEREKGSRELLYELNFCSGCYCKNRSGLHVRLRRPCDSRRSYVICLSGGHWT